VRGLGAVAAAVAGIAAHDRVQRRHSILRNYPVIGHARFLLESIRPEIQQGGLPEFGTELDNPDLAGVAQALGLTSRRVTDSSALDEAVTWLFAQPGPALLDVVTNPDEVAVPPKPTVSQGWGFAIAKAREAFESR
jgi:pyruvate dehydrogenase (quinone)